MDERWREMWLARLEQLHPFYATWMEHQHGYFNAPVRMLQGLSCPRQAIIGPWGQKYPHMGAPGPAIGFLQEVVRWWDHWLKGKDTGIMEEPMLRAFHPDGVELRAHREWKRIRVERAC